MITPEPLLFESVKRKGNALTGNSYDIFATRDGFLVAYLIGTNFYFSIFNEKGKTIKRKKKFHTTARASGFKERVLSISFHDNALYLFILSRPQNIYYDTWGVDLVKTDIQTGRTRIFKKFLTRRQGLYHAKNLKVHFTENAMFLAWMDREKTAENPKRKTYRLSPRIYMAHCSLPEMKCGRAIKIYYPQKYFRTGLAFHSTDRATEIVIRDRKKILVLPLTKNRLLAEKPTEIPRGKRPVYEKIFTPRGKIPFRIWCGPGVK